MFSTSGIHKIVGTLHALHDQYRKNHGDHSTMVWIDRYDDNSGGIYRVNDNRRFPFAIIRHPDSPNKITVRMHGYQRTIYIYS